MLTTVTNTSLVTINTPDVNDGGSGATGGALKFPLPYPFEWIGPLAPAGTKQLPMHVADWRFKRVPWLTFDTSTEWQQLFQAGVVSLAFATETGNLDQEDLFVHAV